MNFRNSDLKLAVCLQEINMFKIKMSIILMAIPGKKCGQLEVEIQCCFMFFGGAVSTGF